MFAVMTRRPYTVESFESRDLVGCPLLTADLVTVVPVINVMNAVRVLSFLCCVNIMPLLLLV